MAVQTPPGPKIPSGYDTYADETRHGWITFAGVLLLLLGTVNVIDGIAAISKAHFYVAGARYILSDLNTWGWVVLCLGALQLLVGLGVFAKNQVARWVGVGVLCLNAIGQLMMMPAYPLWSLCIFAVDIVAVYGLIAHGQPSEG
jgi:hypothetical protein